MGNGSYVFHVFSGGGFISGTDLVHSFMAMCWMELVVILSLPLEAGFTVLNCGVEEVSSRAHFVCLVRLRSDPAEPLLYPFYQVSLFM